MRCGCGSENENEKLSESKCLLCRGFSESPSSTTGQSQQGLAFATLTALEHPLSSIAYLQLVANRIPH